MKIKLPGIWLLSLVRQGGGTAWGMEELVNTIPTVTEARKTYLSPGPVHLRHFGLGIGKITGGSTDIPYYHHSQRSICQSVRKGWPDQTIR